MLYIGGGRGAGKTAMLNTLAEAFGCTVLHPGKRSTKEIVKYNHWLYDQWFAAQGISDQANALRTWRENRSSHTKQG
jgi:hypothetical protein